MNNEEPWDKAKLEEWKKFWDSEMGQEALKKMNNLKQQCLNLAMQPADPNAVNFYVGRAAGIDVVLQDIQAGFDALTKEKEKEDKPAKK